MGISEGARRVIDEKKKTIDQLVLDPNVQIKDFPVDPWTPYMKTNNFIQQGVNRILGFSAEDGKWVRLNVNTDGKLEVAGISSANMQAEFNGTFVPWKGLTSGSGGVDITGHDTAVTKVLDAVSIPSAGAASHFGLDITNHDHTSYLVSTTTDCIIFLQGSDDNVNWYEHKSAADVDRTWNCNNEKIWFSDVHAMRFVRLVIQNLGGSTSTVTVVIVGQA